MQSGMIPPSFSMTDTTETVRIHDIMVGQPSDYILTNGHPTAVRITSGGKITRREFIFTSVPEPTALAMIATAATGLAACRRRKP